MLKAKWLLIATLYLSACSEQSPKSSESVTGSETPLLQLLSPEHTNIQFANMVQEDASQHLLMYEFYYNGAGLSIGDINNDGLPDIYFAGNMKGDKLYLKKGKLRFEDITTSAGLDKKGDWHTGVNMVDINNDGWLDIYVCRAGPVQNEQQRRNLAFINQKDNTFSEQAEALGIDDGRHSVQSSFFDYDLDGDLDMYLLNHPSSDFKVGDFVQHTKDVTSGKIQYDRFYENTGNGFVERTAEAGIKNFAYRQGIAISDLDGNGYPDMYISSDFDEPDLLYFNNGDKTFTDKIATTLDHISYFSMGNEIVDYNNDGLYDICVVDMTPEDHRRSKQNMESMNPNKFYAMEQYGFHSQYMVNTLHTNLGNGHFSETGQLAGIAKTDWSWAPLFFDVDNDGWKDLFVTNGIKRDMKNNDRRAKIQEKASKSETGQLTIQEVLSVLPTNIINNYIFSNAKDGTFRKAEEWISPDAFNSNGAAYGDLDNDGDLDLVVNNMDALASVYENTSAGNTIRLTLQGSPANPFGIGSTIDLEAGELSIRQEHYTARGYLSSGDYDICIGIGNHDIAEQLIVTWPTGEQSILKDLKAGKNHILNIKDATGSKGATTKTKDAYQMVSASELGINFRHKENPHDDFVSEILLPHKQSRHGPAAAVADVNGDGLDDLYLGGASGQQAALYIQKTEGRFSQEDTPAFVSDKDHEDVGATFIDVDNDGDSDLYVASGGNEFPAGSPLYKDRLYINNGMGHFSPAAERIPAISSSGKVVIAEDVDGDGDKDLFVGGRVSPGKYPFPVSSYLLINDEGVFKDKSEALAPEFKDLGMITSGVFTDFDKDGDADLMVAGEWTPILVFENENGTYAKKDVSGLENTSGLWFGLNVADIDGDGDEDLFAGNLGLNAKFKVSDKKTFHIYANDFDQTGTIDIVLSTTYKDELVPVRGRECSSQQMPFLQEKFPDYASFANAGLEDIYGEDQLENSLHYQVDVLTSLFLENTGNGSFRSEPLPLEAQVSPIMDFHVTSDSKIICVGNLYGAEVETVRYDASHGCVLEYGGNGSFAVIPNRKSGLYTKGDTKQILPINIDGSEHLLIINNNGPVQVYQP